MKEDLKIGQVWRNKNTTGTDVVCIIGLSLENMVFVSGTPDVVDPEWTRTYLWENYELDKDYL